MPKSRELIIKVGGSLAGAPALRACLATLAALPFRCVIVPGGGPFAAAVARTQAQWRFADEAAHRMAILGMAQYGLLLGALESRLQLAPGLDALGATTGPAAVWLPTLSDIARMSDLPSDWSVSADSLALWLARELGMDALMLAKSLPPPALSLAALADAGYVDRHLPVLAQRCDVTIAWMTVDDAERLRDGGRTLVDARRLVRGDPLRPRG
jgi:hypothetical protein